MGVLEAIIKRAALSPGTIVLPEGEDDRIIAGAISAQSQGVARPILLGDSEKIVRALQDLEAGDGITVMDPAQSPERSSYADAFYELRKHKGVTRDAAYDEMGQALSFAQMMVRLGDADGSVAGAVASTSDTVRTALQIIGKDSSVSIVSSFFLMVLERDHHPVNGPILFADCALNIEPTDDQLADIAISTAESWQGLFDDDVRIAMLSFSTKGSASHARVDKVVSATEKVKQLAPHLAVDGELQFDSAIIPDIADRKAGRSTVAGRANVLVFPDLDSGNIGYKIAQRIGGARAIGPVLQGLKRPANDLSRGCSAEDVFNLIAITSLQASALRTT